MIKAWWKITIILSCWGSGTSVRMFDACLLDLHIGLPNSRWDGFQTSRSKLSQVSYQVKLVLWFTDHLKHSRTQNKDLARVQGQRTRDPLNPKAIVLAFFLFFFFYMIWEEFSKFCSFIVNDGWSTFPRSSALSFYPQESSPVPGSVLRH